MKIGVLTGTGTYQLPGFEFDRPHRVNTRYGDALVTEGRLGEVVGPGRVRTASGIEDVETLLIGQVQPGDLLLVHAGTAIGRVNP